MPNNKNIHVVPHDTGWAARREGAQRVSGTFNTQQQAIEASRTIARREQGEVLIHGENGQIRERNTYGPDPFPPKG